MVDKESNVFLKWYVSHKANYTRTPFIHCSKEVKKHWIKSLITVPSQTILQIITDICENLFFTTTTTKDNKKRDLQFSDAKYWEIGHKIAQRIINKLQLAHASRIDSNIEFFFFGGGVVLFSLTLALQNTVL